MNYQLAYKNNVAIISIIEDSLIAANSNLLVEEVKNILEQGKVGFVLDLKHVNYLNSSGINLLISILTIIRNEEGELVLASISEKIRNIFIITKLNSIFNVEQNVDYAINFLNTVNITESN